MTVVTSLQNNSYQVLLFKKIFVTQFFFLKKKARYDFLQKTITEKKQLHISAI